jgi:hypothetical protein
VIVSRATGACLRWRTPPPCRQLFARPRRSRDRDWRAARGAPLLRHDWLRYVHAAMCRPDPRASRTVARVHMRTLLEYTCLETNFIGNTCYRGHAFGASLKRRLAPALREPSFMLLCPCEGMSTDKLVGGFSTDLKTLCLAGADAINPYMAFVAIERLIREVFSSVKCHLSIFFLPVSERVCERACGDHWQTMPANMCASCVPHTSVWSED